VSNAQREYDLKNAFIAGAVWRRTTGDEGNLGDSAQGFANSILFELTPGSVFDGEVVFRGHFTQHTRTTTGVMMVVGNGGGWLSLATENGVLKFDGQIVSVKIKRIIHQALQENRSDE
jgi:hypothetical protein